MDVLPTDIPYHSREILCDQQNPTPKGNWKKGTKNKLCQITTPNSIVERVENQHNAMSVDTTVDRPCYRSAKTNQYSDNNPNDRQVANVMSNVITTQGTARMLYLYDTPCVSHCTSCTYPLLF